LGINGGFGAGSSQWTLGGVPSSVFNTDGFLFGGTLGFNYPVSEVLFGLEGDLDWSSLNGSTAGCAVNGGGAVVVESKVAGGFKPAWTLPNAAPPVT